MLDLTNDRRSSRTFHALLTLCAAALASCPSMPAPETPEELAGLEARMSEDEPPRLAAGELAAVEDRSPAARDETPTPGARDEAPRPRIAPEDDGLLPPVLVEAGGSPIDVDGGNSAPCFRDLDGDGLSDLLVGQFAEGRARLYRNVGGRGAPRFEGFELLRAGDTLASVPYG